MPIFARILDFKRDFLARLRNQRKHPRYAVGAGFPLKASLALAGAESLPPEGERVRGTGRTWSGRIGDVSVNGLSLQLPPAAASARGEPTILNLTMEDHELTIPCTVAHFRAFSSHAVCGVQLEFDDFPTQKAYHQLVEVAKLGASFSPAGPPRIQSGLLCRTWRSGGHALLSEWREPSSRALARFEMSLGDHLIQGRSFPPGLEIGPRNSAKKGLPPGETEEVGRLFRWVVGNLPKNVSPDLRALMARVGRPVSALTTTHFPPPASARAFTATVIKVPPSTWRAPETVTFDPGPR